jgi:phage-related protein
MMMNVDQSVEWELAEETEVLGEKLPQRHFVHHKCHMTWPGHEAGKQATNRLSYGTACIAVSVGLPVPKRMIFSSLV